MTLYEFNQLDETTKKILIFEANKVDEKIEEATKFQLFRIENFFVETKTNLQNSHKRTIVTYSSNELPDKYQVQFSAAS